jgi:hypothetical protein
MATASVLAGSRHRSSALESPRRDSFVRRNFVADKGFLDMRQLALRNQATIDLAALYSCCACQGESQRGLSRRAMSPTPQTLDLDPGCHESSRQAYLLREV